MLTCSLGGVGGLVDLATVGVWLAHSRVPMCTAVRMFPFVTLMGTTREKEKRLYVTALYDLDEFNLWC